MDTVTQAVFGGVVAQAGFRRSLGRHAIFWGAAAGLLPDVDSLAGMAGQIAEWVHHRGVTHSIFFGPLVGPLLGLTVWSLYRRAGSDLGQRERLSGWVWLFVAVLITHPLIDLFTHYGTQLLAPLSRHRFAIPAMPIIDPVYTGILLLALTVGVFAGKRPALAARTAAAALLAIWGYTLMAWSMGERVAAAARVELARAGHEVAEVAAYPTLLQPYWRRVVARTRDGAYLIGFRSGLDPVPGEWQHFVPDDGPLVARLAATPEATVLSWFASGNVFWQVVESDGGAPRVMAYDLRYGLPGETVLGFWGLVAEIGPDGGAAPEVFSKRPDDPKRAFATMWNALFRS